jgi:hypothetical protein
MTASVAVRRQVGWGSGSGSGCGIAFSMPRSEIIVPGPRHDCGARVATSGDSPFGYGSRTTLMMVWRVALCSATRCISRARFEIDSGTTHGPYVRRCPSRLTTVIETATRRQTDCGGGVGSGSGIAFSTLAKEMTVPGPCQSRGTRVATSGDVPSRYGCNMTLTTSCVAALAPPQPIANSAAAPMQLRSLRGRRREVTGSLLTTAERPC